MSEPFKLDLMALEGAVVAHINDAHEPPEPGDVVRVWVAEFARQLHTAGAPNLPFEEQARVLLASHRALVEAGEGMPTNEQAASRVHEVRGARILWEEAGIVLDMVRPRFARRTQERDAAVARLASFEGPPAPGMNETRFLVLHNRDDAPWAVYPYETHEEARIAYEHFATAWTGTYLVRVVMGPPNEVAAERPDMPAIFEELLAQRNALRQRAERAETRLEDVEALEGAWHEATGCSGPENASAQMTRLRARTAELEALLSEARHSLEDVLESRPESGADVVERLCCVAEAAIVSGGSHGATERVTRAVLSALAAMGEEAWPTATDMASAAAEADEPWVHTVPSMQAALDLCRSHLSPVIGALRAKVAERDRRIAALETGMREVVGEFYDALAYVDDYFREKYGYDAAIEKAKALAGGVQPAMVSGAGS
jgi:hypothetical protein